MFNIGWGHILLLAFLFMTSLNCIVTYFCSSSSLKYLAKVKSYNKAINRIYLYDKYFLTILNLVTSLLYVIIAYFFFESLLGVSDYFVALSVLVGFVFSYLLHFFLVFVIVMHVMLF